MTDPAEIARDKCSVRDGMFVEPCDTLAANCDNEMAGFSKAKGITRWHYTNFRERRPSRTFYGVKTKASPNGFLFNFCPFCGEKIDAPFAEQDRQHLKEADDES